MDDDLSLATENSLLADPTVELADLTVSSLRQEFPWLYLAFLRAQLDVIFIETSDLDLIEELFSRLNEGVPLTAAEKRNRGRIVAPRVRDFAESHEFFQTRLPFGNRRYRHLDLIAKFMRIEERGFTDLRVPDLRKADLDGLFDRLRASESSDPEATAEEVDELLGKVAGNLDRLSAVFGEKDPFLASVGMVTLYYAAARYCHLNGLSPLTRSEVEGFEQLRESVRGRGEEQLGENERLAVEFARYAQGPTSGSYLTARLRLFLRVVRGIGVEGDPFTDLS